MNKLKKALENQKQENWQEAENTYNELIKKNPENGELYCFLASSQMSQNKLKEALLTVRQAEENSDRNISSIYHIKGLILGRMGKKEEALIELKKGLKYNPNLYQSYIAIGYIYYIEKKNKKAIKYFDLAIKVDYKLPEAHINKAHILFDEGEIEKTILILKNIENYYPNLINVKMLLGQAFLEDEKYIYAEDYFNKILLKEPENYKAGFNLGIAKLKNGNINKAEEIIFKYDKIRPKSREGYAALGILYYEYKQYNLAIEFLKTAIQTGLSYVSWKVTLAEAYIHTGKEKLAIDFFKKIEKNQNNKLATYRLAEIYEKQYKLDKALEKFKKINKSDKNYLSASLKIANIYLKKEKFKKSEEKAKEIMKAVQNHAEAGLILINSFLNQNKQIEALELINHINFNKYNSKYKQKFKILKFLILDHNKKYEEAMNGIIKNNQNEQKVITDNKKLSLDQLKLIANFSTKTDDKIKNPIFVVGLPSTGINEFTYWLKEFGFIILNDRINSKGRSDILSNDETVESINKLDNDIIRLERKKYIQKIKPLINLEEENSTIVDFMYLNLNKIVMIKKVFPQSKIILLIRSSTDMWLHQKLWNQEPILSSEWNETVNQIIAMGLNLTQIDFDLWQQNDKETHDKIKKILNIEKEGKVNEQKKYWQKTHFKKGHWKNYKNHLGA